MSAMKTSSRKLLNTPFPGRSLPLCRPTLSNTVPSPGMASSTLANGNVVHNGQPSNQRTSPTCLITPDKADDAGIRSKYRPFLLGDSVSTTDWISRVELDTVSHMVESDLRANNGNRIKVLVLYGSLRSRSYSRLLSYEFARLLWRLGCDVRVFDPSDLPIKDDRHVNHPKVQELRGLSQWSDGHVWVSPEQHGNLTAVFKNQIDWIPLSTGSVRPTQGRTLAVAQVCGGSQSFNTVNSLRILGRWMRMFTIPNQSSIPKAYTQFTEAIDPVDKEAYIAAEGGSRLMPSGNRDRVVDCVEEFVKYTILMRPHFELYGDRYSERVERKAKADAAKSKDLNEPDLTEQKDTANGVKPGGT